MDVTLGFENGRGFQLAAVKAQGDSISVSMASWSGLSGLHACQQALKIRANVGVEARTCEEPDVPDLDNRQMPINPAWATPSATPVVEAMANKVTT